MPRRPAAVTSDASKWRLPLSAHIVEEMQARGWKTRELWLATGSTNPIDGIALEFGLCGARDDILWNDDLIRLVANALGVSEEFLWSIDSAWRAYPQEREEWECPDDIFTPIGRF